jgi:hypothetical protein
VEKSSIVKTGKGNTSEGFFYRINFKKGRVSTITTIARKLTAIIWNMVVKGVA